MRRRLVVVIVAGAVLVGCSSSDGSDSPDGSTPASPTDDSTPVLGRIDGPAQVDPSFDPMQVDPTMSGTESGG